jgi:hypothetical protein
MTYKFTFKTSATGNNNTHAKYIIHYFHRGPTFVDQWAAGALNRDNYTQCCTTFSNAVINHGWILFRPACVRIELHKCMRWENYGTRSVPYNQQVCEERERDDEEKGPCVCCEDVFIRLKAASMREPERLISWRGQHQISLMLWVLLKTCSATAARKFSNMLDDFYFWALVTKGQLSPCALIASLKTNLDGVRFGIQISPHNV